MLTVHIFVPNMLTVHIFVPNMLTVHIFVERKCCENCCRVMQRLIFSCFVPYGDSSSVKQHGHKTVQLVFCFGMVLFAGPISRTLWCAILTTC